MLTYKQKALLNFHLARSQLQWQQWKQMKFIAKYLGMRNNQQQMMCGQLFCSICYGIPEFCHVQCSMSIESESVYSIVDY